MPTDTGRPIPAAEDDGLADVDGDWTLYLDGSGDQEYPDPHGSGQHNHFVQAGILVNEEMERQLSRGVEDLLDEHIEREDPANIEVHASEIMVDSDNVPDHHDRFWPNTPSRVKGEFMADLRNLICEVEPILFGRVVDKGLYLRKWRQSPRHKPGYSPPPEHPSVNVMRFLLGQVNKYCRANRIEADVILDEDTLEEAYLELYSTVEEQGHNTFPHGTANIDPVHYENLAEPIFIDSESSRGMQIADVVANYTWRAAEMAQPDSINEMSHLWAQWGTNRGLGFWRVSHGVRLRYD